MIFIFFSNEIILKHINMSTVPIPIPEDPFLFSGIPKDPFRLFGIKITYLPNLVLRTQYNGMRLYRDDIRGGYYENPYKYMGELLYRHCDDMYEYINDTINQLFIGESPAIIRHLVAKIYNAVICMCYIILDNKLTQQNNFKEDYMHETYNALWVCIRYVGKNRVYYNASFINAFCELINGMEYSKQMKKLIRYSKNDCEELQNILDEVS
jgi:hypothetical protein